MLQQRPIREKDTAAEVIRMVLLSMASERRSRFIGRIVEDQAPDVQIKIYDFVKSLICAWASHELYADDAFIVEQCRKICDVMGWKPKEV